MKKLSFISILICSLVIFTIGCKKDATNSVTRIKYVINNTNDTTKYTYDNENRILTEQFNSSNTITYYFYKGSDSIILSNISISTNDTIRIGYYKLNANGVATDYSNPGFNNMQFVYNSDNYKIFESGSALFYSSSDSFNITNNNVTSSVLKSNTIGSSSRTVNTYTLDSRTNTITNDAIGSSFLGKSNANLITALNEVKTSTSTLCIPSCTPTVEVKNYSYTYEFDTENRVTRMIQTNLSNSSTVSTRYVYY